MILTLDSNQRSKLASFSRVFGDDQYEGGFPQLIQDILDTIAASNVGITADAWDVDSLALGGGSFAQDDDTTTALTFGYMAGRVYVGNTLVSVAAGTVALAASSTNYIEVDRAGVVSDNATGFTAGSLPLYEVITSGTEITTVTNKKPLLTMLSTPAVTKEVFRGIGDVAATRTFRVIAPAVAAKVSRVAFTVNTTHVANNTDYWAFTAVNRGPAGTGTTAIILATDVNTTKSTGGSGFTAGVARLLSLHTTPANLVTAANDVLEFTLTKNGAAVDLDELDVAVDFLFSS